MYGGWEFHGLGFWQFYCCRVCESTRQQASTLLPPVKMPYVGNGVAHLFHLACHRTGSRRNESHVFSILIMQPGSAHLTFDKADAQRSVGKAHRPPRCHERCVAEILLRHPTGVDCIGLIEIDPSFRKLCHGARKPRRCRYKQPNQTGC